MKVNRPFFKHFVIESIQASDNLDSIEWLEENMHKLLSKLGIKVVKKIKHRFNPQGTSLIYILSSSHAAVHTYPENNYLHIDIITCSKSFQVNDFTKTTLSIFGKNTKVKELRY